MIKPQGILRLGKSILLINNKTPLNVLKGFFVVYNFVLIGGCTNIINFARRHINVLCRFIKRQYGQEDKPKKQRRNRIAFVFAKGLYKQVKGPDGPDGSYERNKHEQQPPPRLFDDLQYNQHIIYRH